MLSDEVRDLITSGNFATLTTLLPDGRPMAQVMWVDCDDEYVVINTEVHRLKFKNMEVDRRVVVCIWDNDDPYHYIEVRGDVVDIVRGEPARRHIDELAMRYFGRLYDGESITSERVIVRVRPDRLRRRSTAAKDARPCGSESGCGACSRRGRRHEATCVPTGSTSRTPASPTSWATTRCGCPSTTSITTATAPPC